jgi:serine/threonine protein kinase
VRPDLPKLFGAIADLSPGERAEYFTEHSVDADTRRELEELLAHDSSEAEPFAKLISIAAKEALRGDATGMRCGAFRLVSVLGTGGMGVVYLAHRADGEVSQRAAVKLMQPGWSDLQRERFLREREILAALTHPNIAHLLDAGHSKDGQPYLAMEYVEGKRIDEYCEGLTPRQKVELFLKVCSAVEYLHANFVLHRDLKPSNILVTARGEPKLLDFGIAKILDLQGPITVTQMRMVTPDYASPEQLMGTTAGPVSDIYSLGAVLYCLLTGAPAGSTQNTDFPADMRGDIELVLETAMRPDPQDRYSSVADFASDLQACLDLRPVRARRREWIYRARKFVRRQPITTALVGALVLALAGVGGLWKQQVLSGSGTQDLRPNRLTANTPDLPIQGAAISPDGGVVAYTDSLGIHLHTLSTGETRLLPETNGHLLLRWTEDGSGLQTQTLDQAGKVVTAVVSSDGSMRRAPASPVDFVMSPDGRHRARAAADPPRVIVEDSEGRQPREVWIGLNRSLDHLAWTPDSKTITVVSSEETASTVETVSLDSGHRTILIGPDKGLAVSAVAWPARDRAIAVVDEQGRGVNSQGSSNLWEIRLSQAGDTKLRKLTSWTDFPIRWGSLTTDGKRLVFIRSFRQRDVYVAELELAGHRMEVPRRLTLDLGDDYPTAWTPDSKAVIFTSDRNGPSAIFRQYITKQTAEQLVFGPTRQIIARATPDSKWILFYGADGDKRGIMRAPMSGGKAELLFPASNVMGIRCSHVGPCTLAERDGEAVVVSEVDPVAGTKAREIYRESIIRFAGPDISPDGRWLATPFGSKIILRSFATGAVVREISVHGATNGTGLLNLDYAADGKGFFVSQTTPTETRQLYVDMSGEASLLWRQAGKSMSWGIPSPNGKYLAMMIYTDDSNVYTIDDF